MNAKQWRKIQAELMKKKNVVAVGRGEKVTAGKRTGKSAIICSVVKKDPASLLKSKDLIPATIENEVTDVFISGIIRAQLDRLKRHRPAPPGVSIGHEWITAGTFGCLVRKDGETYILSNNHVLADSNNGAIGSSIFQPGKHDGGALIDTIARLFEFVPINFGGAAPPDCNIGKAFGEIVNVPARLLGRKTRLQAVKIQAEDNLVDAAIAYPVEANDVIKKIVDIGIPAGYGVAKLGMKIQKSGRTTGLTNGEVLQTNVAVNVQYGEGKIAMFVDQLMAGAMSAGGDSGSVVLDMDKNVVGLLFAGSDESTVINPIQHVIDLLGLETIL